MPCYRLFFRHAETGHFTDSQVLGECDDDREALSRVADHMPSAGAIELWERDRLVAVLTTASRAA